MNIEKWTIKMQEAMQNASKLALDNKHQVIDVEHILLSLLEDSSGILYRVLTKKEIIIPNLKNYIIQRLENKPKVDTIDINSLRLSYDV
jgi:ATPases with chaperone activity, ATP-binding subunit